MVAAIDTKGVATVAGPPGYSTGAKLGNYLLRECGTISNSIGMLGAKLRSLPVTDETRRRNARKYSEKLLEAQKRLLAVSGIEWLREVPQQQLERFRS